MCFFWRQPTSNQLQLTHILILVHKNRGKTMTDDHYLTLHRACQKKDMQKVGRLLRGKVDIHEKDSNRRTPLLIAVQKDCVAITFQLLEFGEHDLNAKDIFGKSALFYATEHQNHTIVTHLLARNADPNTTDCHDTSALMRACQLGCVPIVTRLLQQPFIRVEQRDQHHATALWHAASHGNAYIVEALLANHANAHVMNLGKKTPLLIAAANGQLACVRALLRRSTANVNMKDRQGKNALEYACANNSLDIFTVLVLDGKANIQVRCELDQTTLLMTASKNGFLEIVEFLLEQGTDSYIDAIDCAYRTALYYACDHPAVFDILLTHGASPVYVDRSGKTILMRAAELGSTQNVQTLLQREVEVDQLDNDGYTAFAYACLYGHVDVASMLLEAGACPSIADFDDKTPLMLASFYEHDDIVKLLLRSSRPQDIGVDCQDFQGMTALSKACLRGCTNIAKALLTHGASTRIADQEGMTPLMHASRRDHTSIVEAILDKDMSTLNAQDSKGQTALYHACERQSLACVTMLLGAKARDDLANEDRITPLMLACFVGNRPIVEELLNDRVDGSVLNQQDNKHGQSALYYACDRNHTDIAMLLLAKGADLTKACDELLTPLSLACGNGNAVLTEALVQGVGKYHMNSVDDRNMTALFHAAAGGHLDCVKVLLTYGADAKIRSESGATPLMIATERGHVEIIKALVLEGFHTGVARKMYVNHSNDIALTPLHQAASLGNIETAAFLIEHGASCRNTDDRGNTPLILACLRKQYAIVDMCLQISDGQHVVNRANHNGMTPLYYAITNNDTDLVKLLGKHGAKIDVLFSNYRIWDGYPQFLDFGMLKLLVDSFKEFSLNATNRQGKPALLVLASSFVDKSTAIKFLLSRGANPWIGGPDGRLPIVAARTVHLHDLLENAMREHERFRVMEKARVLRNMYTHMDKAAYDAKTRSSKRRKCLPMAPQVIKERLETGEPLPTLDVKESTTICRGVLAEIVETHRMNDDVFGELYEMMRVSWD